MGNELTPQQAQAVYDRGGKLLVSAAAGSGKTKVLVDRLLRYLTDPADPANLDAFLIITYTKAAASELRAKIAAKLTERIAQEPENRHLQKQMQRLFLTKISTVHGFCSDLLREYAYRLDLPADFRMADENECRELRETVLADMLDRAYGAAEISADFLAFVDTQGLGRSDKLVPEIIEKVYDSARCHLNPQDWLDSCLHGTNPEDMTDASETVWGKFLMEDLFGYLDSQIQIFRKCIRMAEEIKGYEKPVLNLKETLCQLEALRQAETWDEIVKNRDIRYGTLRFPPKIAAPEVTEPIKAARDACKKGMEKKLHSFADPSAQIFSDLSQTAAATRGLVALVRQFDREYSQAKRSRRVLDFSDLEHKTLDLLLGKDRRAPTALSAEIGRRFREIMVDEYQDSNGVQDAIFDALTRERQNCFMVGDVKQSIYQFRLADPGIFLEKYHRYVPAETAVAGEGRKVHLSRNFRSGGEVIEAVNDVFSTCMTPQVGGLRYGEAEALCQGGSQENLPEPGAELYVVEVREDRYQEEAAFVADKIQAMLKNGTPVRKKEGLRPVEPEDIVILLRSPGSTGSCFQRALEARGIRCSSGGGMDLLQTQEIATLRSLLQCIVNPRQDIPLISTLASPVFGFTADDLANLRSKQREGSIYDALLQSSLPMAAAFVRLLEQLRRESRLNPLTQLLQRVFSLTRLDSIYGAMAAGENRQTNLQIFYQLAADFEAGSMRDLGQFLDHLDALEEKGLKIEGSSSGGSVTIMSIHKSKGLEFPVVFLCNLSKVFNMESCQAQILCDRELGLGLSVADSRHRIRYPSMAKRAIAAKMKAELISEEMRVLYVAMTRARDRLIMTYAAQKPEGDLKDLTLRLDFDGGQLLCRDAVCPGDWVLLTAVQRIEAGELHAVGDRPRALKTGGFHWKIGLVSAPETETAAVTREERAQTMPEDAQQLLETALGYAYPHIPATQAPSKQTATGRKGRQKDQEAAEGTREPKRPSRSWRRPGFLGTQADGLTQGNAIHAAMQYLRYEACGSAAEIRGELNRMVAEGLLKQEQASLVSSESLAAFFATDIGQKLRSGTPHLREFKFSILDSGSHYGEGLEGEQVLLQGVVDCALLEPDGITVVDFKTDRVTEKILSQVTDRYRLQVETYADALARIYEMPVKEKYLYFFRLNQFVKV